MLILSKTNSKHLIKMLEILILKTWKAGNKTIQQNTEFQKLKAAPGSRACAA